ncbi:amino acid permease [Paenibacillus prosopidis]|uniref:Amino acid/polyamine/organocation transporter (APC superfamily) n=1 Tax=Paenibacillus prosopidis TaxID=630520 RepID=A0A368VKA3_9BACL|nr:amino acid permease [Paenibacillus prosopidis]RCW41823.1 amino acid/polyamine/organocation transporter (APC superfamily) [Paenibacillus prosopidis]
MANSTSGRAESENKTKGSLTWWQLALFGLGTTIGTGFLLGSSLAIEKSGFSVLLSFFVAAIGTYFVFQALAKMIAEHPEKGSFRTYSRQAFGHWAGFSHGWVYWSSEMLILGSQLTAIGLFTRFWFPHIPLWILISVYSVLGVGVVLLGTAWFEKTVNMLAIVKIAAILMFIILTCLVIPGFLGADNAHMHAPSNIGDAFKGGSMGLWTSLIYVFFCFAGIEVMGIMAGELKNPKDAPKSGRLMVITITVLFISSLGLALLVTPIEQITTQESPFVSALKDLHYHVLVHIFNGVLIIAGFSGLVASLYSVTLVISMIADEGDAPKLFAKRSRKRRFPYGALGLTITGMAVSITVALLLPNKVYEYITTAGGLMLLYTWLYILCAARKLLKLNPWGLTQTYSSIALLLIAVLGTLFDQASRPGFFISLVFLALIGSVTFFMRKRWRT